MVHTLRRPLLLCVTFHTPSRRWALFGPFVAHCCPPAGADMAQHWRRGGQDFAMLIASGLYDRSWISHESEIVHAAAPQDCREVRRWLLGQRAGAGVWCRPPHSSAPAGPVRSGAKANQPDAFRGGHFSGLACLRRAFNLPQLRRCHGSAPGCRRWGVSQLRHQLDLRAGQTGCP